MYCFNVLFMQFLKTIGWIPMLLPYGKYMDGAYGKCMDGAYLFWLALIRCL